MVKFSLKKIKNKAKSTAKNLKNKAKSLQLTANALWKKVPTSVRNRIRSEIKDAIKRLEATSEKQVRDFAINRICEATSKKTNIPAPLCAAVAEKVYNKFLKPFVIKEVKKFRESKRK